MNGAAERLGVSRQTLWRSQGLRDAASLLCLRRWRAWCVQSDEAAAAAQGERTGALERRVAELEGKLEAGLQQVHSARTAIEEQGEGAAGRTRPPSR